MVSLAQHLPCPKTQFAQMPRSFFRASLCNPPNSLVHNPAFNAVERIGGGALALIIRAVCPPRLIIVRFHACWKRV